MISAVSAQRTESFTPTIHDIVARRSVRSVYQPIVDLRTGQTVAFEALARGPAGSHLESPMALFDAARQAGLRDELEWICQATAIRGALDRGLKGTSLFVNIEPETLGAVSPSDLVATLAAGRRSLRLVAEITERALTIRPVELMRGLESLRDAGMAIALDDVGANRDSVAMLPLVNPDVIKLDMGLVQGQPDRTTASYLSAVAAHAEASGAHILAEGIETEKHLITALALGATFGQGWHFARPGPLPEHLPSVSSSLLLDRTHPSIDRDPAAAAFAQRPVNRASKRHLLAISRHLENWALTAPEHPILLAAFQEVRHFTPRSRDRFAGLGAHLPFVAALGVGVAEHPAPGVRGASLAPDDPLTGQWDVVVLGSHFSGALISRDVGDDGPDMDRRFDFVVTHDRDLVTRAARSLMSRIGQNDERRP
ncbi:MAG: EAL domain-containing protein [Chloroflexi bacterium]|nr:EAL domain-containing protein [Chloroflexota bacterium]